MEKWRENSPGEGFKRMRGEVGREAYGLGFREASRTVGICVGGSHRRVGDNAGGQWPDARSRPPHSHECAYGDACEAPNLLVGALVTTREWQWWVQGVAE